jgi:hypothetical protein
LFSGVSKIGIHNIRMAEIISKKPINPYFNTSITNICVIKKFKESGK